MPQFGMDATEHKKMVGARLRVVIEALNLTQAEVARRFCVSPSKLGNWLRGDTYPSEFFILKFCDRFSVSTDFIYRGAVAVSMPGPLADALWEGEQALQQAPGALALPAPGTRGK